MIQYLPIILICSMSMSVKDCHKDNPEVLGVTVGEIQPNIMSCLTYGNVKMASTSLIGTDNKYYMKIKCVPKEK